MELELIGQQVMERVELRQLVEELVRFVVFHLQAV
jgi:hypothetical protein